MDMTKLFDVRGKTALVTGATSGIGRMIADGLVSAGARVWIGGLLEADVEAAVQELSALGECHGIAADLSTDAGIARIRSALGGEERLHILVNNAGTTWVDPLGNFPREGFETVVNVNLIAPFLLIQALLPLLRKAGTPDDPARVINISSVGVKWHAGWPNYSYTASKGALEALSTKLATVLVSDNITVNCVAPGPFKSPLTAPLFDAADPSILPPLGKRWGRAEDMVGAVIFLASPAGAWITGDVISPSGGHRTLAGEISTERGRRADASG